MRSPVRASNRAAGAVVVCGDYQGLGIVRSLGRQGVPVCVVDDELSISKYSQYCTHYVRLPNLRTERAAVDSLLEVGKRLGLSGWVLYPTREELVAALSRNRLELGQVFRVPTPEWSAVQWMWDKRNTYRLAQELGIPIPRTHYLDHIDQLAELDDLAPPFAIKPAIKEHFVYATKAKAWSANNLSELRLLFQKASELVGP
jgi:predicted ATP-grasp superfamily ATP-dependent carboligase